MRNFVRAHSRVYFCALSDFIAKQSIEIDHFARSAENESSNRKRLDIMIDDYLDDMHYLNDILLIKVGFWFLRYLFYVHFCRNMKHIYFQINFFSNHLAQEALNFKENLYFRMKSFPLSSLK